MGTSERKNILQPTDWWLAFEKEARKSGLSLSEWIGKQCRKAIAKDIRDGLSERRKVGQPRKEQPT